MSASTAPWFGRRHALRALPRAMRLPRRWAVRAVVLVARFTRSQMHWACPCAWILTGGQAADITQAIPLMKNIGCTGALLADKGYDANALLDWLGQREITAVIPPKANRKEQRSCDWHLYKERHVIECMFGKLKYFRRIATRYEKKASHFMEMLAFAAVLLWLR